jgi:DNA sulfur modification protein DndD
MIFKRISILNLFSYYGEREFVFSDPVPGKPIALIFGKNGFGKTNFINCIKLLFLGTSTPMLEDVASNKRFSQKSYLLGSDIEWQGALNAHARRDARANGAGKFGVTLEWREENGHVVAQRFWTIEGDNLTTHLEIDLDFEENGYGKGRTILDQEEAEEFLQRRLPRDIVSLFFYDGEKVQYLAEKQQQGLLKNIEKLLGLAAIDTLDDSLKKAVAQWRKDGIGETERAKMKQHEQQLQSMEADKAVAQAKLNEIDFDIDELERDIKKHERYINNTKTLVAQRDVPERKEEFDALTAQYEAKCRHIAETLPKAAPIWAMPSMLDKLAIKLQAAASDTSQRLAEEVKQIFSKLPERLFNEPPHSSPHLTPHQKENYKRKLENILKTYTETPGGGYLSLNPGEIAELQKRLNYYTQAQDEFKRLTEDLHEGARLKREWQKKKAELEAVEDLPADRKKEFIRRQEEMAQFAQRRDTLLMEKGGLQRSIGNMETELNRKRAEIQQQENNLARGDKNSRHIAQAQAARQVFERYREKLKMTKRGAIEEAVNRHLTTLLTSNPVIAKVEIMDDFALNYLREDGSSIGLINISAGMKQLVAQALLWALSDISGRKIPVVIDTPLARIDRQNQNNLLLYYYPAAAEQVIILPTDSELDIEKYQILKPMINTEFRLSVTDGHTKVHRDVCMHEIKGA